MNSRILAVARKELLQLLRDKKSLPLIFIVPIIQVILFGYVTAMDIKHIGYAVLDRDQSAISREIVAKIDVSGYFENHGLVADYKAMEQLLDRGEIRIGLVFPAGFSRQVRAGQRPALQVLIDGTDSNTAAIAQNYFANIIRGYAERISSEQYLRQGIKIDQLRPLILKSRNYYNPELRMANYMIPGISVLVLILITTMLTALSIVKEKEQGTIEQIMVTPIKPWEFILGKLLPFPLVGLIDMFLVLTVGGLWFGVPLRGGYGLLFLGALLFIMTNLGIGLLISSISRTQQQAMLSTVFILIPSILLSGFVFPIANMPKALQVLTYLIPARYFLEVIRGVYLKGIGFRYLYPQLLLLLLFGVLVLGVSISKFKKQLE